MPAKKTTEQFIKEAKEVHGDKYSYHLVEYERSRKPVKIFCKKHRKVFEQNPFHHLQKRGCPDCGRERTNEAVKRPHPHLTEEEFIQRAQEKHGDFYDYSDLGFTKASDYLNVICPVHGPFKQTGKNHLAGYGCKRCYDDRRGQCMRLTNEEFIERSQRVHNFKYDYSETEYVSNRDKVLVKCEHHGPFWTRPDYHSREVNPVGCPECARALYSGYGRDGYYGTENPASLYLIKMSDASSSWLKVGVSKDVDARIKQLSKSLGGVEVEIMQIWEGPAVTIFMEGEVPTLYYSGIPKLNNPDWDWGGRTECFDISYKQQLEEFLTETLSPLENVERIL